MNNFEKSPIIVLMQNYGKDEVNYMKISDFLEKDRVLLSLTSKTKKELLNELGKTFKDTNIVDEDGFARFIEKLNNREGVCSTGFQDGVAIPHVKARAVKKLSLAFGLSRDGIEYDALDRKLSKIFFMIASPKDNPNEYLKLLGKISEIFLDENNRNLVLEVKNEEELLELLDKYEI